MNNLKSLLALACAVSLSPIFLAGCRPPPKPQAQLTPELSADELWKRTLETYRRASRYRDAGHVTLSYKQAGQRVEDKVKVSVTFERPDKLHLQAYHVELASDGRTLSARVQDEGTNHVDGQVVVRDAPPLLAVTEILSDPLIRDMMGNAVLAGELGQVPPQIELLLADSPYSALQVETRRLQSKASCGGRSCHRLELVNKQGAFVFWIDDVSYLVRRLEFPRGALIPGLTQAEDISDVQLVAEFEEAEFNATSADDTFKLEIPEGARLVRFFVPPPRPLPSALFGKSAGEFALTDVSGGSLSRDSLAGKIAVLVWFNDDPACETALRQLELVYERLKDDPQFSFAAVCTEPSTVSHSQLRQLMKRWGSSLPLVRDFEAHGRDIFQIVAAPTMVVLDARGIVQVVEVGANPQLAQELPTVLEKLAKGERVSELVLASYEREQRQYQRQLAVAGSANRNASTIVDLPETPIKERSEPKHLKLTRLWSNEEVAAPGNLLVVDEDGTSRVWIVSAGRSILELDRGGQTVREFPLELLDEEKISFVRTGVNRAGRRKFAASGLFGQRVIVLDEDGQQRFSYPPRDQPHQGIRDVQLVDLDLDGELELYVGFWGVLGVHRVAMNGEREWTNRSVPSTLSLAVSAPDDKGWRKILVTSDVGTILPISDLGASQPPVSVAGWEISHLHGARFPGNQFSSFCGLSYSTDGDIVAVALGPDFIERWNYPLPPGLSRTPLELVTSGTLSGESGEWVFAGADGSIHFVSADGEFSDYFNSGEQLTGLGLARAGDDRVLLVASPAAVSAWRVEYLPGETGRTAGRDLDLTAPGNGPGK